MKKIKLLLFILLPIFVFSQGTINQTDSNGLRQGSWKKTYSNGKLRYEGQFKDNKPVGEWNRFYKNGKKQAVISYSEKSDSASAQLFDSNGKFIAAGIFLNEKKEGLWKFYSGKQLVSEEEFKAGKKHGLSKKYYKTGEVLETCEWIEGLKQGKYQAFFKNGKPYLEYMNVEDKPNGFCISYFENGRKEMEAFYKNGSRHNSWKFYNQKGEEQYTLEYNFGALLNPEVLDSLNKIENAEYEKNKNNFLDPEKFLNNPSEYLMQNKMNR